MYYNGTHDSGQYSSLDNSRRVSKLASVNYELNTRTALFQSVKHSLHELNNRLHKKIRVQLRKCAVR